MSDAAPLAGVRVVDLSRVMAGPFATQLLADLGADVVKIERPGVGDESRLFGPPFLPRADGDPSSATPMFLAVNRGKRSVALDLSSEAGRAALLTLLEGADILVENFKVGTLARLGLDPDMLRSRYPRLILCSITGYGQTGPYAPRGGYDPIIQALCGLMSVNGLPGAPMKTGPSLVDIMTGLYAANAIQAALLRRVRTGQGAVIDMALLDVGVAAVAQQMMHWAITGAAPDPVGNGANGGVPGGGYACADGYVMIAPGNEAGYRRLCAAIGRADLGEDPRFATNRHRLANRRLLLSIVEPIFAAMRADDLVARLLAHDVPAATVHDLPAVIADPHVAARGLFVTLTAADGTQIPQISCPIVIDGERQTASAAPPDLGVAPDR